MKKNKKKIAIVHPRLIVGGGSESCAMWAAQILKESYEVSLITMGEVNLSGLNEFYGTNIKEGEVAIITIPLPFFLKKKFDALRTIALARYAKKNALQFDVMISTYNVMDFGKKGIQFLADFSFDDHLRRTFNAEPGKSQGWWYKKSFARMLYLALAQMLSGTVQENWKKNITLANSYWTQHIFKKHYGITPPVVYPPVVGMFAKVPWDKREDGFVYVGRISPEKQIEKIIHMIAAVRKKNSKIHLHIIGGDDDSVYAQKIKKLCQENNQWCFLEGQMQGPAKLEFIGKHKYGISARSHEPFGIAVAEMVKSGCIVFVPDGGGQVEIVGNKKLIYESDADAVRKIEQVILSRSLQKPIQKQLLKNSVRFSIEMFTKELQHYIKKLLSENKDHGN
jgi:glycosyltransferase involved in cell wall biosynthesis